MPVLYTEVTARADADPVEADENVPPVWTAQILPLGRLSGSQSLDLGMTMFRGLARTLVPVTIAVHLPIEAVDLWLRLRSGETAPVPLAGVPIGASDMGPLQGVLMLVAHCVALSLLGIATGILISEGLAHRRVRPRDLARRMIRGIPTALGITLISLSLQIVMACVPVIGAIAVGTATSTTSIVAGAEGTGPWRAIRRSFRLAAASTGLAAGLYLGGLLVVWIVRFVLFVGPLALVAVLGLPDAAFSWVVDLGPLTLLVLQPLTATMAGAAYLALRTRSEGLDLMARIAAVGGVR